MDAGIRRLCRPRPRCRSGCARSNFRRFVVVFGLIFLSDPAEDAHSQPAILLANGGFDLGDAAVPDKPSGWDKPDGLGVQWTAAGREGEDAKRGKAIRMDTSVSEQAMVSQWRKAGIDKWDIPKPAKDPVAATYGLSYYSDSIPVATGQAYRVSFLFKGPSGGAKVWVRGFGKLRNEERRLYETIVNCRGGAGWTQFSQCFHPTRRTPGVATMRVMLYAYWPPGVYWFDDVKIAPVSEEEWKADSGKK